MNTIQSSDRYERARRRVKQLREFYTHLTVYAIVIFGLAILNLFVIPDGIWFIWPMFGWGIGVVAHAVHVYGSGKWLGADWEERTIQRLMEEEAQNVEYDKLKRG
jgi:hypothetical protein